MDSKEAKVYFLGIPSKIPKGKKVLVHKLFEEMLREELLEIDNPTERDIEEASQRVIKKMKEIIAERIKNDLN